MRMVQCPNGHNYDADVNQTCPYCNGNMKPINLGGDFEAPDFPPTIGIGGISAGNGVGRADNGNDTVGFSGGSSDIGTTGPWTGGSPGVTQILVENVNDQGNDTVRGWLVCIEGKKKGETYTIFSENNYIGRSRDNTESGSNQIVIDFDENITRIHHASIEYDKGENAFYANTVEGKSNIRINDAKVRTATKLNAYDIITIGETKLIFVPLCCDKFKWPDN